jgi:hypothetical protein
VAFSSASSRSQRCSPGISYSLLRYLAAAVGGVAAGLAIAPFLPLSRDDGGDAQAVERRHETRGRADTPIEGAQAADRQRWERRRTGERPAHGDIFTER